MRKMKIMSVVGARPNLMKIAPFVKALEKRSGDVEHFLVHSGQHYDRAMSGAFFEALGIPEPDINLGIGSGTHAEQVGRTMIEFDKVLQGQCPDWVVVVGDVNATCACSVTAVKHHVRVAHIEAGLRSFDRGMPEEINRIVTDRVSDLLFTTDEMADVNLKNEGVAEDRIKRVGNIMIDTQEKHREAAAKLELSAILQEHECVRHSTLDARHFQNGYAVLTLHRPSNVDEEQTLAPLVRYFISEISKDMPLVWTLHPRTRKQLESFGLWQEVVSAPGIILVNPLGYREMLRLNMGARIMLTDSGGLQEECCVLGTPCITLRENTERPVTLREHGGTCELAGNDVEQIRALIGEMKVLPKHASRPSLWDGKTAKRIVNLLADQVEG